MRDMVFGQDSNFTEDAFVVRFNADLSNGLGNLASRVLSMQHRYFSGVVQAAEGLLQPGDEELREAFEEAETAAKEHLDQLALHLALETIWRAVAACDKYVVETAPFKLWKSEEARPRVGVILHVLCDALRHTARLIAPFMPETAGKLAAMLDAEPGTLAEAAPPWTKTFLPGHRVAKPEPLFPRIETEG
jgi:methionyl-tRNA synthetase